MAGDGGDDRNFGDISNCRGDRRLGTGTGQWVMEGEVAKDAEEGETGQVGERQAPMEITEFGREAGTRRRLEG